MDLFDEMMDIETGLIEGFEMLADDYNDQEPDEYSTLHDIMDQEIFG